MFQKSGLAVMSCVAGLLLLSCFTASKNNPADSKAGKSEAAVAGPVSLNVIPSAVRLKTGEIVELSAVGWDKFGKQISLNSVPNWKITSGEKSGSLNKAFGEKVQFTGKSAGICNVLVSSGPLSKAVSIEVMKAQTSVKQNNIKKDK